jgi:hypothetical protein
MNGNTTKERKMKLSRKNFSTEELEAAWWTWHDLDMDRWSSTVEEAETRCKAWVDGESDDGPDIDW